MISCARSRSRFSSAPTFGSRSALDTKPAPERACAPTITLSVTVMRWNMARFWNVRPRPSPAMRWIGTSLRLWPSSRMSPDWYWYSRLMQLNSVVLPAPLGPISPQMSPRPTSKLTLSSATMPPNRTDTPRTLSNALPPLDVSAERGGCAIGCREELCRSSLEVRKAARVIGGPLRSDNARLHCPLSDTGAAASWHRAARRGRSAMIGGATMNQYQQGLERCGANLAALEPGELRRAQRRGVRRSGGGGAWRASLHLGANPQPCSPAGRGAARCRRGPRRDGERDAGQHARDGRGALRGAGAGRGAQHVEHAARRAAAGLAAQPLRSAAADHRHRVLASGAQGAANSAAPSTVARRA